MSKKKQPPPSPSHAKSPPSPAPKGEEKSPPPKTTGLLEETSIPPKTTGLLEETSIPPPLPFAKEGGQAASAPEVPKPAPAAVEKPVRKPFFRFPQRDPEKAKQIQQTRLEKRQRRKERRLRPPTNFKREVYAVPNLLTYFRIAMIPLILIVLDRDSRWYSFLAGMFFAAACVTDFFDGYLARKLNQITILGKLLDPLADKLIVASTLIIMIPMGRVPSWVVILLLSREFAITGLRGIAASEGLVISASSGAKYKTAFQMIAIFFLLVHYSFTIHFYGLFSLDVSFQQVGMALLYISLFYSMTSGFDYFWKFAVQINERYKETEAKKKLADEEAQKALPPLQASQGAGE